MKITLDKCNTAMYIVYIECWNLADTLTVKRRESWIGRRDRQACNASLY